MTRYLVLALIIAVTPAQASVRLPKILGSHMVLQQNASVRVWVWAAAGETVHVAGDWFDTRATTQADAEGRWQVTLKTGQAGGPHTITVTAENVIQLEDILFGEVWIGSGQSNMEMPLVKVSGAYTGIENAAAEIAQAQHPEIRLF